MTTTDESEIVYCSDCSGSGEGQYDGSTCSRCKGRGEVYTGESDDSSDDFYYDDDVTYNT